MAALAFVVLMIVAAIPISAIVLMYGGASVEDIVRQQIVLLATAIGFGAIGLFFSALLKRTQAATVLTYCSVLALTLGTAMLFIFWTVAINQDETRVHRTDDSGHPSSSCYLNPRSDARRRSPIRKPGGLGRIQRALYAAASARPSASTAARIECVGAVCDSPSTTSADPVANGCGVAAAPGTGGRAWSITFVIFAAS